MTEIKLSGRYVGTEVNGIGRRIGRDEKKKWRNNTRGVEEGANGTENGWWIGERWRRKRNPKE